jgi:hypothetical protein
VFFKKMPSEFWTAGNSPVMDALTGDPLAPNILDSAALVALTGTISFLGNRYLVPEKGSTLVNGFSNDIACGLTVGTAAVGAELANWALRGGTNMLPLPDGLKESLLANMRFVPPGITAIGAVAVNEYAPFGDPTQNKIVVAGKAAASSFLAHAAYNFVTGKQY